jgi:hypothetical protein
MLRYRRLTPMPRHDLARRSATTIPDDRRRYLGRDGEIMGLFDENCSSNRRLDVAPMAAVANETLYRNRGRAAL